MLSKKEIIRRPTKTESFAEMHCRFQMQVSQSCPQEELFHLVFTTGVNSGFSCTVNQFRESLAGISAKLLLQSQFLLCFPVTTGLFMLLLLADPSQIKEANRVQPSPHRLHSPCYTTEVLEKLPLEFSPVKTCREKKINHCHLHL